MRIFGIHLQQTLALVATPRPSVVAELDAAGRLVELAQVQTDDEIVTRIGSEPAIAAVDAPLRVPNATGSRDLERVLAWCDIPLFPVSIRRLATVHGGHRGDTLLERWPASAAITETSPDLALRMMAWLTRTHGTMMDLAAYREAWLGLRAPRYRPKGAGRATPDAIAAAAAILADHLDLAGWTPEAQPDDWGAIRDAAAVDALACAWVAHRAQTGQGVRVVGTGERGALTAPVDANLAARIDLTLTRLRDEGQVVI